MTTIASVPAGIAAPPLTLVDNAIDALLQAMRPAADGATAIGEERSVYQPDT